MQAERHKRLHGYGKVEIEARFPRRWSWAIYRSDSETVVLRAPSGFTSAEDAWRAGQSALRALEVGDPAAMPIAA